MSSVTLPGGSFLGEVRALWPVWAGHVMGLRRVCGVFSEKGGAAGTRGRGPGE